MGFFNFGNRKIRERLDRLETAVRHEHPDALSLDEQMSRLNNSFNVLEHNARGVSEAASDTATYLKRELENTRYRFFTVIDNMVDIVVIKDSANRWITANRYIQQLLGLQLSDYYMKTDEEICKSIGKLVTELDFDSASDETAWASGEPVRVTESFVDVRGVRRYFDVIKTPTFADESRMVRKEMIIVGRDVTDIQISEQRNRACINALNSASDLIIITDGDTRITFCNDAFIHAFGFESHSDVEGEMISILKSGQHTESFYKEIWDTVVNNQPWKGVIFNRGHNGSVIECDTTIVPVMNGAVRPIHYIQVMKVIGQESNA